MALSRKPIEIVNQGNHQLLAKAEHWKRIPLADIALVQNGFAFKSELFTHSEGIPLIRIRDIEKGQTENNYIGDYSTEYVVKKGDILIGMDGDFNAAIWSGKDGLLNQRVCRLIPFSVNYSPEFLFLCLQPYLDAINAETSSVTVKHLSSKTIGEIPLPLPPYVEQLRIVAKIEELFSELDKGVESLKTAREQLKVYRQALLKHAFEGKLTQKWREQNQDKLETAEALLERIAQERAARYQQQLTEWQINGGGKPKYPKSLPSFIADELNALPEIPQGWCWVRLLDACEAVVDCHNKTAPYQEKGIPLIRTPSIKNMKLNFDDSIRYVSQETYEYWSRRCPPLPGDILFTREAPMGEAALIPEGKTVCMGQRIMLLRPGKFLSASYLLNATQNPVFKKISAAMAVGTGVKHLRVGDVEKLVFPLCSQREQSQIADLLEQNFSKIDQFEQAIALSLQQAEALRQSILKRAFSGQLVEQDPNDEPAAELLARIQAEKAAQPHKVKKARS